MNQPELAKGINFGWYLHIWMNVLHNEESVFWKTMTPYRCSVLYGEFFKMYQLKAQGGRRTDEPSLSRYLMGGE